MTKSYARRMNGQPSDGHIHDGTNKLEFTRLYRQEIKCMTVVIASLNEGYNAQLKVS